MAVAATITAVLPPGAAAVAMKTPAATAMAGAQTTINNQLKAATSTVTETATNRLRRGGGARRFESNVKGKVPHTIIADDDASGLERRRRARLTIYSTSDRNDLMSMTSRPGVADFSLDGTNQTKRSE